RADRESPAERREGARCLRHCPRPGQSRNSRGGRHDGWTERASRATRQPEFETAKKRRHEAFHETPARAFRTIGGNRKTAAGVSRRPSWSGYTPTVAASAFLPSDRPTMKRSPPRRLSHISVEKAHRKPSCWSLRTARKWNESFFPYG